MKVGVSTATLFMRREIAEALATYDEWGIDVAEVFLSSFSEYDKAFGETLVKQKGNVEVNSVHVLTSQFEPQLFARHEGTRKDAYGILKNVMETAQVLSAKYYTFHGLTRAKKASLTGENDRFPKMAKDFREMLDFCQSYGVQLCLENVEWSTYNRLGVFSTLAAELPDLRGVLDIKQARISGIPYEKYLSEMGERIAYAHLSDITTEGKMCLPGRGNFPFADMIKRLQDVGFDGALLIEAYENDYQEESEIKTSCEYLKELLYKHGCLT